MIFSSSVSDPSGWIPAIVGIIITILGGGGLAALLKSRPEGSKLLIDAATGVVVVQTGVMTELRNQLKETQVQLKEAQAQIEELRGHMIEMSTLRVENDRLKERVSLMEVDNQRLRNRVDELEHQLHIP